MKLHLNINSFVISQDVFENVRSLMPNLTKISGVFGLSIYVVVFFDQINNFQNIFKTPRNMIWVTYKIMKIQMRLHLQKLGNLEDLEKLKIHTLIGALLKLECHPCYALSLKYALICMAEH